jgi:hypothetical protein
MSDLELTMMRRVGELKAEVERLKKFNDEALAHIAKEERKSRERLDMEQAENARLKAEVERLTKAGDSLYKSMLEIGCNEMADNFQYDAWRDSMKDWNAAKEGKPRA